jgi:hypothetical protein
LGGLATPVLVALLDLAESLEELAAVALESADHLGQGLSRLPAADYGNQVATGWGARGRRVEASRVMP